MAVRKNPVGGWLCEIYPNGAKSKRIRKKFATKREALAFECMGEPLARDFDAQMFSPYREKRLKGKYAHSTSASPARIVRSVLLISF